MQHTQTALKEDERKVLEILLLLGRNDADHVPNLLAFGIYCDQSVIDFRMWFGVPWRDAKAVLGGLIFA